MGLHLKWLQMIEEKKKGKLKSRCLALRKHKLPLLPLSLAPLKGGVVPPYWRLGSTENIGKQLYT